MNIIENDKEFIRQVNEIALQSAKSGFDPFGAILVNNNKIVATSADKCIQYSDPTAHAELILISEFCRDNHLISLEDYTLYCNVEPCVMCSGAIHWSRISKVVFSVSQAKLQTISKGKLKPSCRELINTGGKPVEIVESLLEDEGMKVLASFPFTSKKAKHQAYQKRLYE